MPTSLHKNQDKDLSSHGAECNMGNIFRVSHILQQIVAKKWEMRKIFANIARGNVR